MMYSHIVFVKFIKILTFEGVKAPCLGLSCRISNNETLLS